MTYTPDTQTSSIFASLALYGGLGILFTLLFEYFRHKKDVYYPKLRKSIDNSFVVSKGFFSWIKPLLSVSDEEIFITIGLDGYIFLRFIQMCAKIGLICSICGGIIMLPVYATAPPNASDNAGVVGINIFTMGNILNNGHRLWCSWVMAYVFTFVFLYFIYKEYENFAMKRQRFFHEHVGITNPQTSYTVLVENIPKGYQTSEKLKFLFDRIFPNDVIYATIFVKTSLLDKLFKERHAALSKLEHVIALYESDPNKVRPEIMLRKDKPVVLSCFERGQSTDAINYWIKKIEEYNHLINPLQIQALEMENKESVPPISSDCNNDHPSNDRRSFNDSLKKLFSKSEKEEKVIPIDASITSNGFITFKTKTSYVTACGNPILFEKYPEVKVTPSSEPSDILWSNMSATTTYTTHASTITSTIFTAGLLFWGIIILFISSISSLSNLQSFLPFLGSVPNVPYALIATILPVVVMNIFMALLPIIIATIAQYVEKRKTTSKVQEQLFGWYFLYQIVNVYLILLGGSLFNALSTGVSNPASIVVIIGTAVPTVAVFFINYTTSSAFLGFALLLLRIGPLIVYSLYHSCICKESKLTRRDLMEGPMALPTPAYGVLFPNILYILCIMLLEWIVAPIVLIAATVYFCLMYIGWKYQYVYVLDKQYESGGILWFALYKYTMIALMIGTITVIGYMGIKEGQAQTPLLVPLPIIILFVWRYTESKYKIMASYAAYDLSYDTESEKYELFNQNYHRNPNITNDSIGLYPYRLNQNSPLFEDNRFNPVYYTEYKEDLNKYLDDTVPSYTPPAYFQTNPARLDTEDNMESSEKINV